jgi:LPS sulfotransferase NodH
VRFVILFPGRTGSSFLVSCLHSHPSVIVEGERLVRRSARRQQRWLRRLYDTRREPSVVAVGFKTKLKDVWSLDAFAALLRERGVRVIALRRRDVVRLAVSTINARRVLERTGRWNQHAGSLALPPLQVAPADLERMIENCIARQNELERYVADLGLRTLQLDYDDLLLDRDRWLGQVTAFLDLAPQPLHSDVVKATDDDLRRALANYDEIAAHFRGGPHASAFGASAPFTTGA